MTTKLPPAVPFGQRLAELRGELSRHGLAVRTRQLDSEGKGLSHTYIAKLERNVSRPSAQTMELVAAALEIDPAEFLDYRLHQVRSQFDQAHGLERAARHLSEYEARIGLSETAAAG